MVAEGNCDFHGWHFPKDPNVNGAFRGVVFQTHAYFDHATVADATFTGAKFRGNAVFKGAVFAGAAFFTHATFTGEANFAHATFGGDAIFIKTSFGGNANFGGATFTGAVEWFADCRSAVEFSLPAWRRARKPPFIAPFPFRLREKGESPYRAAKQASQNAGHYRKAGDYHYYEQCAILHGKFMKFIKNPWQIWRPVDAVFELVLARGLFGYGERALRPLVAGAIIISLCAAGCYWGYGGIDGAPFASFPTCFYFSVVTFTTLGYGDLRPAIEWRWLAGAEAFSGVALMALFIVALAKSTPGSSTLLMFRPPTTGAAPCSPH